MTAPKPDLDLKRELMLQPVVMIVTPYSAETPEQEHYHNGYLGSCIHHSILSGEAPIAGHGFYTRYLDDTNPFDRALGQKLGQIVMARASFVAVYEDLGKSPGMLNDIRCAQRLGLVVQRRKLGAPWKPWREEE